MKNNNYKVVTFNVSVEVKYVPYAYDPYEGMTYVYENALFAIDGDELKIIQGTSFSSYKLDNIKTMHVIPNVIGTDKENEEEDMVNRSETQVADLIFEDHDFE